ncbi:hypothetical protein M8J76_003461 [Diaphorina citri]|nr:hypothetical protein M8J76_003461 [Diaphorina citri]
MTHPEGSHNFDKDFISSHQVATLRSVEFVLLHLYGKHLVISCTSANAILCTAGRRINSTRKRAGFISHCVFLCVFCISDVYSTFLFHVGCLFTQPDSLFTTRGSSFMGIEPGTKTLTESTLAQTGWELCLSENGKSISKKLIDQ